MNISGKNILVRKGYISTKRINYYVINNYNHIYYYFQNVNKVTKAIKKQVAGRQKFACNNKFESNLLDLEDYECPLWPSTKPHPGNFDGSGYGVDYVLNGV